MFFFSSFLTVSVEFGRAVWLRFYPPAFPPCPNPSFVAHLGGVVVGLTLGVVVLQNYEQKLQEQSLFWIFFCVYTLFVLSAVFWNIFAYSLLDVRLPPPPWPASGKDNVSPLFLPWIGSMRHLTCYILSFMMGWSELSNSHLSPSYSRCSDVRIPDLQSPLFATWFFNQPATLLDLASPSSKLTIRANHTCYLFYSLLEPIVKSISQWDLYWQHCVDKCAARSQPSDLRRQKQEQSCSHGLTLFASSFSIQPCLLMETSAWWKYFCTVSCRVRAVKPCSVKCFMTKMFLKVLCDYHQ